MYVRIVLDEELHNIRTTVPSCLPQRLIVFGMHICPMLDEELHSLCVAIARCIPQRLIVQGMHVCAIQEEELHNVCAAILRCPPQRPVSIGVHVCAMLEEEQHSIVVATLCSVAESSIAASLHVSAIVKKQLHCVNMPAESRAPQGPVHYGCVALPGLLLLQGPPRNVESLVHARQARQLNLGQVAQHQGVCHRRERCHYALEQQGQFVRNLNRTHSRHGVLQRGRM